ncbi:DUF4180 domain-containing protein [Serratia nevei]|uniref:DUF4180 domain-containing protein n=1 Tax=Serratia nevei TaxID=2703794 RepID=UPI003141BA2E
MSYAVRQIHDRRLVVFAEAGPPLKDENDVSLFIAPAFEHDAGMLALPVNRLDAAFFQLRSGVAGAVLQKFINYRLRVALLGDITPGWRKATRCKISCVKPTAANRSGSSLLSPNSNSGLAPDGRQ